LPLDLDVLLLKRKVNSSRQLSKCSGPYNAIRPAKIAEIVEARLSPWETVFRVQPAPWGNLPYTDNTYMMYVVQSSAYPSSVIRLLAKEMCRKGQPKFDYHTNGLNHSYKVHLVKPFLGGLYQIWHYTSIRK
jgi:hypothetical protein